MKSTDHFVVNIVSCVLLQSGEVLQRQDELHKELVAKELRLQEELLTRKYRNDIEKLKKDYAEDLARNVNQQRTTILVRINAVILAIVVFSLSL